MSHQQDFAGVSVCRCGFLENPHQQNTKSTPTSTTKKHQQKNNLQGNNRQITLMKPLSLRGMFLCPFWSAAACRRCFTLKHNARHLRQTIAIDLSQRAHVAAPVLNNLQKRNDEHNENECSILSPLTPLHPRPEIWPIVGRSLGAAYSSGGHGW